MLCVFLNNLCRLHILGFIIESLARGFKFSRLNDNDNHQTYLHKSHQKKEVKKTVLGNLNLQKETLGIGTQSNAKVNRYHQPNQHFIFY